MSLTFLFFGILAVLAIATAVICVSNKNPVVSAMALVAHFFMLAGLYLTLQAQFIAILQILIYAGAIMVLVIFVIMLLNLGDEEKLREKTKYRKILASLLGIGFIAMLCSVYLGGGLGNKATSPMAITIGAPAALGKELFTNYLFAFEAIALLLLTAIIGAVVLAKRKVD
ncbi:MAG: NADH-ubiquinone oxidoreductase chain [Ignavibacteria bacterium]|nr:NADH-ubiquinone oxidoreductase chain [Ignavibacteria bacterium]